MKKILLAGFAAIVSLLVLASCNKEPKTPVQPVFSFEVTNITPTSASVSVTIANGTPQLVRITPAAELETVGIDINDPNAVAKYATDNGSAANLPYTRNHTGLQPLTEYVVAAVAFDESMKLVASGAKTFKTLAPDNAIGDDCGAGTVTDRTL